MQQENIYVRHKRKKKRERETISRGRRGGRRETGCLKGEIKYKRKKK